MIRFMFREWRKMAVLLARSNTVQGSAAEFATDISGVSFRARKSSLKQRYCIDFRRIQGPSGKQPCFE